MLRPARGFEIELASSISACTFSLIFGCSSVGTPPASPPRLCSILACLTSARRASICGWRRERMIHSRARQEGTSDAMHETQLRLLYGKKISQRGVAVLFFLPGSHRTQSLSLALLPASQPSPRRPSTPGSSPLAPPLSSLPPLAAPGSTAATVFALQGREVR